MNENEFQSIAVFCDYENIAYGVAGSSGDPLTVVVNMKPLLDRLLLKGSIVFKRAYCDWGRFQKHKRALHDYAFELVEIPHRDQSGKNSADIRLVVDALDLCYTKTHVTAFAIISGDSDFSPLVSKLKENGKKVVGIGARKSASKLLVDNCDEFIYYEDLVSTGAPTGQKPSATESKAKVTAPEPGTASDKAKPVHKGRAVTPPATANEQNNAIEQVVKTLVELTSERGAEMFPPSLVKQTVKRIQPDFNEKQYGFSGFERLLEAAAAQGLVKLDRSKEGRLMVGLHET
jgi:uncharacterized LabA/DUF88 family protein